MGPEQNTPITIAPLNPHHSLSLGSPYAATSFIESAHGQLRFLSKGQWTYGPTLCLSIDTHIRSNFYRVVYF